MDAPLFLPLHCPTCSAIRLESVLPGAVTTCRECGSTTIVVPGESYTERDVPLFSRIEGTVRQAQLTRRDLRMLASLLADVEQRLRAPEAVLLRVLDFLPGLHFLIPSLYASRTPVTLDRGALIRATGMIQSLISVRVQRAQTAAGSTA